MNNVGEYVEKREPYTLLVEMQTGTAITENSIKIPSGIYPKEIKSVSWSKDNGDNPSVRQWMNG